MMLRDLDGKHVDGKKLRFLESGQFEGIASFKFHKDAVEYAAACKVCDGVVNGVIHIEDPALQITFRTEAQELEIKQLVAAVLRERHHCSILYSHKRDAEDWFKDIARS